MMKNNAIFRKIVIYNTFGWLFITAILPNLLTILISFSKKEPNQILTLNFTLKNFFQAFSPIFIKIYLNSIEISIFTTLVCLVLGYPFAYIIYSKKSRIKKYLLLISIMIPLWTSSLIRTYAIICLIRLNGLLNNILIFLGIINSPLDMLYSKGAVIFGFVYTLIPFMIIPIYLSLRKIDTILIESAKDLGASGIRIFFKIIFPLSYNGVISGCSMVFLSSLGMFYLSDLLGGSKNALIGNIIKNQFLLTNNWNLGCAISIILYLAVIFWIILQKENSKLDLHSKTK